MKPGRVLPKTSWTLIAAAQDGGPQASAALNEFSRRYYAPIKAYLGALAGDREESDDLTQSFFAEVVASGRLLRGADPTRTFRPYLKQALRNHVISGQRRGGAKKRIPDNLVERPDVSPRGWDQLELRTEATAEADFHAAWVRGLLKEALGQFRKESRSRNQLQHFELFTRHYLSTETPPPSWRQLGEEFELDQKVARSRAQTAAKRFGTVLLSMLVEELGSEQAARKELNYLVEFLVDMHA